MDVESFASYVHWIYTGTIKIKADEPDAEKKDGVTIQLALIRLYIAADTLSDMALRNATIDRMIATCNNVTPGPTRVTLVYDNTPDGSKLRQLMTDYYLNYTDLETFKEKGEKFPKAFLVDVLCNKMNHPNTALNRLSSPIAIARSQKSCRYHEHGDQLPECSKA